MKGGEGRGEVAHDGAGGGLGERSCAAEELIERQPADMLDGEVGERRELACGLEGDDARGFDGREDLAFARDRLGGAAGAPLADEGPFDDEGAAGPVAEASSQLAAALRSCGVELVPFRESSPVQ